MTKSESEKAIATLDEMVRFVPEHLRAEMERAIETVRAPDAEHDALTAKLAACEDALRKSHGVLVMLTGPDAIKQTTAMQAWAQAVEAEVAVRAALSRLGGEGA